MRLEHARGGENVSEAGERIIAWVWRNSWICLFAICCFTVVATWYAKDLKVDNAVDIWFVEDDPSLVSYRDFQKRFGNDEMVVVAFHDAGGMLTPRGLHRIREASDALASVDGVARVESLATLSSAVTSSVPMDAQVEALRAAVVAAPELATPFLSADETTAIVLARMETLDHMDDRRGAILAEMEAALDQLGTPYRMMGIGVVYEALNRLSTVDSAVLIAAGYLVTAFLLWLFYRRLVPTLVTLAVVAIAMVWTMGLYAAAGRDINMVTMVLPTLITVVGVANCIHILRHVAAMPERLTREERVVKGVGFMFWPCLFNAATTAIGFAALLTAPMPVIRDLGLFSAAGLVLEFVLTILVCTWALRWARTEPSPATRLSLGSCATALARLGQAHHGWVLAAATVVTLGAAGGISRLVVDTNPIDFLFADHEVRQDYEEIERRFDGYTPLEFVVRGDGNILRPEIVAAVGEWQRDAEVLASVGWSTSAIDFLDQRDLSLPISTTDQPNAASTIDPAGALRVTFFVHIQSARQIAGIIDEILAAANLPPGVDATASGYLPLYVRMVDYLVSSQINSFAFALITIFVMLAIFFRSWRMALLSLPSNLLPILLTLGSMGWLGIRLDVATVTIAAIVLGIVVDDTVLFLYSLRHEQEQRASQEEAVQAAVEGSGQSILITSLVLGLGFLVYGLAEIKSVVWFGLLVSLAMGAAVIADLMVLPALIARFTREPARDDAGKAAIALRPDNAC